MAQSKIVYDLTGGTDMSRSAPNIEGTALSINCFTEANTEGKENKDVRTFLQSCPGVKYLDSFGDKLKCDGLFVPSTGLKAQGYEAVYLIDTTDKFFKSPQEAKWLMLGGSTLLFGKK